jgi:hypothetical protein
MRVPAWQGDWEKRVYDRVSQRDFPSVTAFADSRPTASLKELAHELGRDKDVAALQLERLLRREARDTGRVHRFARAALVREIHEFFPRGWMRGERVDFSRASVWAKWISRLGDEHEAAADRVWESLERRVAEGWLPSGPDDPIILKAFQEGRFPEDGQAKDSSQSSDSE